MLIGFLDKHLLDPTGGPDSYRLTKEMRRRNRNQRQRQDVKDRTIAEKLQQKALYVETVSRESRQGQMVILYPLIESLYQAYLELIQNGLIVGDFPTWYTKRRRQWGRGKYENAICIPDPRKKNRHGNVTARVDMPKDRLRGRWEWSMKTEKLQNTDNETWMIRHGKGFHAVDGKA